MFSSWLHPEITMPKARLLKSMTIAAACFAGALGGIVSLAMKTEYFAPNYIAGVVTFALAFIILEFLALAIINTCRPD